MLYVPELMDLWTDIVKGFGGFCGFCGGCALVAGFAPGRRNPFELGKIYSWGIRDPDPGSHASFICDTRFPG